ncbi:MAG: DUF6282 family protein [Dehalococcoidia bacterium]
MDTHQHIGPEGELERRYDALDAAQQAQALGMRAIVPGHARPARPLAALVNRLLPGFTAVGAVVCDLWVGGLNPLAVQVALEQGARVVWMPTWTSHENLRRFDLLPGAATPPGRPLPIRVETLHRIGDGIRLVDNAGALVPAVATRFST